MKKLSFLILTCVIIVIVFSSYFQPHNEKGIICYGAIKSDGSKVSGVLIKIFRDNKALKQIITGRNGSYGFSLAFNYQYRIEISKQGYLKEEIHIDTRVPVEVIALDDALSWEPDIILYQLMPGIEIEEFERPLARYAFNEQLWRFTEDEEYKSSVEPMIINITKQIEILRTEKYNSEISKADSLFSNQKYEEAMLVYYQAQQYNPEDAYPVRQIKSSKKGLKKAISINEEYERTIIRANNQMNEGNFEAAGNLFQKALIYKPKETYPIDKLYEIDSVRTLEWIKQQQAYENYVSTGDSLFNSGNLTAAISSYNEALEYFPKEEYPGKMLTRIDSIQKEEFRKQREAQDKLLEAQKKTRRDSTRLKSAERKLAQQQTTIVEQTETDETKHKTDTSESKELQEADDALVVIPEIIEEQDIEEIKPDTVPMEKYKQLETKEALVRLENDLEERLSEGDMRGSSEILKEIGTVYQNDFNLGKALESFNQSLEIKRELGDKKGEAVILSDIASVMYDSGSYETAIDIFEESLEISEELEDKKQSAELLDNIATVYENTYRYDKALTILERSVSIKEDIGDMEGISSAYKNMGQIYYEQNRYDKAIEKIEISLKIDEEQDNIEELASGLNNLGAAYYNLKQYDKAVEYYERSLEVTEKTNNLRDQSITLNNIGNINFDYNRLTKAIEYYQRSLKIKTDLSFMEGIATTMHNIGNAYFELKEYDQAVSYYKSSQEIAEEANFREVIWRNYKAFARTFASMRKYREAYENYREYANAKFETDGQTKQLVEMREQYESSKLAVKSLKRELQKQNRVARYEAERHQKEMQIQKMKMDAKQQQLKRKNIVIISFTLGILIVLIFSFIITKQYRLKNKAYHIVAQQKEHITDGIAYAARIQKAVLPPEKQVKSLLPEHFIINKPCQTVGGDFYWVAKHHQKTVVAVADCTGHGVPGGFMSMLGVAMLNEIISAEHTLRSDEILSQLRDRMMDALHQKSGYSESLDGMDISLVMYDNTASQLEFSGAYHAIYHLSNNELQTVKGDRLPIGYHFKLKPFTSKIIKLKKGDTIYLTTDGYGDQIGQETNQRFMMSNFKNELVSLGHKPMAEQKNHLEEVLLNWKGNLEQTDDILVIGLRF